MIEDYKIEKAVEFGLSKVQPSSDLLDRIIRQAENLELRTAPVRPSFWSRLRLGPKLELVAACILLVILVGVGAYRNLNFRAAPGGRDSGSNTQTSTHRIYSGDANDGMVRLELVLDHQSNGDWNAVSTIQNISNSTIELRYECDNLVRLNASLIKRDCTSSPNVILEAGQTKKEELTLSGQYQGTPTEGWITYMIRSEGPADPVRTVRASIQEGVRECCPEPDKNGTQLNGLPSVEDVTRAYFSGWPTASEQSLDQSVVATVLGWLQNAQVVDTDEKISFNRGSEFYLVLELRSGKRVLIRQAMDCEVSHSTPSACLPVDGGYVNVTNLREQVPRLHAPELADWLRQASHPAPLSSPESSQSSSPAEGASDLKLGGMQVTFSSPSSPAKITPERAKQTTEQHIGQPPAEAKVTVEYVLMTLPDGTFGRNWVDYPVYLITYDGIKMGPPSGPMPQGPAPTPNPDAKGKITAIIDANTGDWIMAVAR